MRTRTSLSGETLVELHTWVPEDAFEALRLAAAAEDPPRSMTSMLTVILRRISSGGKGEPNLRVVGR